MIHIVTNSVLNIKHNFKILLCDFSLFSPCFDGNIKNATYLNFHSFGVLRHFQHCTGHITTGSWKAEETSTYSSSGFCTVKCRPTASNYQLSHLRPSRGSNPGLRGGRRECYHSTTVAPLIGERRECYHSATVAPPYLNLTESVIKR